MAARQDRSGGGLGLAICKMIIAAHRGRIWAENTSGGAKLSFVLPVDSYIRENEWIQRSQPVRSRHGVLTSVYHMPTNKSETEYWWRKDEPEVRNYLDLSLRCHGYDVDKQKNGEEAIKLLKIRKPAFRSSYRHHDGSRTASKLYVKFASLTETYPLSCFPVFRSRHYCGNDEVRADDYFGETRYSRATPQRHSEDAGQAAGMQAPRDPRPA